MISLTIKATSEIKRLMIAEGITAEDRSGALRVRVVGGGCSGMSYKLGFERISEETQADGTIKFFDVEGVRVAVDTKSFLFIKGMELDFSDGLNGKGFVFNNPNAKKTCGCGNSFSA